MAKLGGRGRTGGKGKNGGKSAQPRQLAAEDVVRGVLETFHPRNALTTKATAMMPMRNSDPGQDSNILSVVLIDSVTETVDPDKLAATTNPGVPRMSRVLTQRVRALSANSPNSAWARVIRNNLLQSLAAAHQDASDPAHKAAIEEAVAHISTRWT
jgi:hypothetical protein